MATMCYALLVTGGPPVLGGGMPQRISVVSRSPSALRTGRRIIGEDAGHWRQVADVAVHDTEERKHGGLASRD